MFSGEEVKTILKREIAKGNESFVIYPMGPNGMMVKNILRDYFGRKPAAMVDKEWSQYNKDVISLEELREQYKSNQIVILTIEESKLNAKLLSALQAFVPKGNIINLLDTRHIPHAEDFSPERIFPGYRKSSFKSKRDGKSDKIKVRFIHNNFATFNAIETICEAFAEDSRFDLVLILGQNMGDEKDPRFILQAKEHGYKYIAWDEYDSAKDRPDILVVSQVYDWDTVLPGIEDYLTLTVAACTLLIRNVQTIGMFWNHVNRGFARFHPDYYLFDPLVYQDIKNTGYLKDNMVEMGNAKFDNIWRDSREKKYPAGWEKIKGKKTVLWAIDHGVLKERLLSGFTFDLYARQIFEWGMNHPEVGVIFRPHDRFHYEMKSLGFWSESDFLSIKDFFSNTPNMIYDDSENYGNVYSVTDGILVDAVCGMSVSALATDKPLCLAYRSHNDMPIHKELADNLYSAYSPEDAIAFFEMVSRGDDPRKDARETIRRKIIKSLDGKNGQRIKEFIADKYFQKYENYERGY